MGSERFQKSISPGYENLVQIPGKKPLGVLLSPMDRYLPTRFKDIRISTALFLFENHLSTSVTNYWERLEYLQLMSLQRRRERYAILHVWKIFNKLTSNDLNMNFNVNRRYGIMAQVPPINTHSSQKSRTLYDNSFAVLGPRLWNTVPKGVKECASLLTFKFQLDDFLKTIPDRPPVPGYICQNNNSILDWRIASGNSLPD